MAFPDQRRDPHEAAAWFLNFLQRQGSHPQALAFTLRYQARQAQRGIQEITTPQQEAMEAQLLHAAQQRWD